INEPVSGAATSAVAPKIARKTANAITVLRVIVQSLASRPDVLHGYGAESGARCFTYLSRESSPISCPHWGHVSDFISQHSRPARGAPCSCAEESLAPPPHRLRRFRP